MAVLENRVKEPNADSIIKKVFNNRKWITNYDAAPGGRIWVVWDRKNVELEVYQVHEQYIVGQVTMNQNRIKFNFGAVYGMHTIQDKKTLWEDLRRTINGISGPSLIMSDFNTIISS